MTELREELSSVLRAVDPSPAPVEETMRLGRALRTRRRAAIVAFALAVAAIAVGYPTLARQLAAPAPAPVQHLRHDPVITDTPPAPGSAAGTVAQGKIGATRWQAILRTDANPATLCLTTTGIVPSMAGAPPSLMCGIDPASGHDPVGFTGAAESGIAVELGNVASDVTYFVLTFADGQQLKLIPVTVFGHRYIAFAAPLGIPIASLTAHLGGAHFDNGTIQTAIPFTQPGMLPDFSAWLRPGQPGLARVTAQIGSGTVDGTSWAASAYQGPWGICIRYMDGGYCAAAVLTGTGLIGWGASPMVVIGKAATGVAYLEITFSDGTALPRVSPVSVGEQRLFAFAVPKAAKQPGHWAAYSASGTQLAAGTFNR